MDALEELPQFPEWLKIAGIEAWLQTINVPGCKIFFIRSNSILEGHITFASHAHPHKALR